MVSTLGAASIALPRECPHCGVYAGLNVSRVLDPYLRKVDIWPEFDRTTCQFEVARGYFETLRRQACVDEAAYLTSRGVG